LVITQNAVIQKIVHRVVNLGDGRIGDDHHNATRKKPSQVSR